MIKWITESNHDIKAILINEEIVGKRSDSQM